MRRPLIERLMVSLLALALLAGCRKPVAEPAPAEAPSGPANAPIYLDHAQPKLRTIHLWLGSEDVTSEVALTQTEVATGMMFRKDLGEQEGMLFVFRFPHRTGFYMKNTTVPLTAAYIDPEGIILELHDLNPLDENAVMAKSDQVQYVLEMKQGWFKRHHLGAGTAIRTERGTLRETFSNLR
jgi:uncharacterized protein